MYEDMTYEKILGRMLMAAPGDVDKREGSILYDALAPAAMELAQMYVELDVILHETFADTASRVYLIKRASEKGLTPYPATYAAAKGIFDCEVPIGSRFSLATYYYVVTERLSDTEYVYQLVCETPGQGPNATLGRMVPCGVIAGLKKAELTQILILGEDEEDTESFRLRYLRSLHSKAFGGNIEDYKEQVNGVPGVGGVKVYPVWNGGGTVKLVIVDANCGKPTTELVDAVQEAVDPVACQGKGNGIAPIGHVVTVAGVMETVVELTFSFTYQTGWNWDEVKEYVEQTVDDYFAELNRGWAEQENVIVRISQLESRLLDLEGIVDVEHTKLNGVPANLTLGADCIAKRGEIHV